MDESILARLQMRQDAGLWRQRVIVDSPEGRVVRIGNHNYLQFASNDYLGLANHPAVKKALIDGVETYGVGAGGSHLVGGHKTAHAKLEQRLAAFVGKPKALLFSSGYSANLAILRTLAEGGVVFADRLNHASLNDAALLARAKCYRYRHVDLDHLEKFLKKTTGKKKVIATDAVFSMDGDLAPIPGLLDLARRYECWLCIDDAHGFGVLGDGRGSLAHFKVDDTRIIYMGTLGKAAGGMGAFIAAEAYIAELLLQTANTYIYTTAMPPAMAQALLQSLTLIEKGDDLRQKILAHKKCFAAAFGLDETASAIAPLLIGDTLKTLKLAENLFQANVFAPPIRPPTVPQNTSRIRFSFSAAHTSEDIHQLCALLQHLLF